MIGGAFHSNFQIPVASGEACRVESLLDKWGAVALEQSRDKILGPHALRTLPRS